ncbi:hypothetical protein B0T26DRAFT_275763 [Lasiosphaeria miniovina]|uniref:Uncharacterized protein n=1 Tax=Lasiosphaeria miniovina TaxID=1954250 RepID=A0AA40DUN1_9PEZI|nr:uncharacterized protein B0T26DRAFT_275763 [Lasiosphaeria miniovina]KAK0717019.1 hypothetical protein B0T26DRAFT_275763 [Lasiosphaeria miniovina]
MPMRRLSVGQPGHTPSTVGLHYLQQMSVSVPVTRRKDLWSLDVGVGVGVDVDVVRKPRARPVRVHEPGSRRRQRNGTVIQPCPRQDRGLSNASRRTRRSVLDHVGQRRVGLGSLGSIRPLQKNREGAKSEPSAPTPPQVIRTLALGLFLPSVLSGPQSRRRSSNEPYGVPHVLQR